MNGWDVRDDTRENVLYRERWPPLPIAIATRLTIIYLYIQNSVILDTPTMY